MSVPQFTAITHNALNLAIIGRFDERADHRLDTGAHGAATGTSRQPADADDDQTAGNRDAYDQRQCYSQSRRSIVEENDGTDDKCRQAADAQRPECRHKEFRMIKPMPSAMRARPA